MEPTYQLYLQHLLHIFSECYRVLKPTGTCFVNLGDSYAGSGKASGGGGLSEKSKMQKTNHGSLTVTTPTVAEGIKSKSLVGIPERFMLGMIDMGWILRNKIVWWKRNSMPSSRTDGFTIDWEHLFFFTKNNNTMFWVNSRLLLSTRKKPPGIKGVEGADWEWSACNKCNGVVSENGANDGTNSKASAQKNDVTPSPKGDGQKASALHGEACPKCHGTGKVKKTLWDGWDYYFEQQFEPYEGPINRWGGQKQKEELSEKQMDLHDTQGIGKTSALRAGMDIRPNPLGRNMRCVWDIPTAPLSDAHYAAYPKELVARCVKAGCPQEICVHCGTPRVKVYRDGADLPKGGGASIKYDSSGQGLSPSSILLTNTVKEKINAGYTTCRCEHPAYQPGIVMDIFGGSGTTGIVARENHCDYILFEMVGDYIKIKSKRAHKHLGLFQ